MNGTRNWKAETVAGACESRLLVRAGQRRILPSGIKIILSQLVHEVRDLSIRILLLERSPFTQRRQVWDGRHESDWSRQQWSNKENRAARRPNQTTKAERKII
jgi:hypothetical protein